VQLGLAGLGLGLGAIEFSILQPNPLVGALSWQTLWLPALSLLIFTGLTEELIFRGLLQPLARDALGRPALVYVALLFAVLHVGYLSLGDVAFVFAVGLLFAAIVQWSGSILGVTLAHGLTNIMLLLVLPYLAQQPGAIGGTLPWLVGAGSAIGLGATAIVAVGALRRRRAPVPAIEPSATLRSLRRSHGLSYTELAQRSGVSVRELAAIEHGLRPVSAEQLQMLLRRIGAPAAYDGDGSASSAAADRRSSR
jgi:DNA-binding XRE family transcriptional regulator